MANFDIKINNCSKLDWRILMDGSVSLYHNADILKKDIQWLKNAEIPTAFVPLLRE